MELFYIFLWKIWTGIVKNYLISIIETIVHKPSNDGCFSNWKRKMKLINCKNKIISLIHEFWYMNDNWQRKMIVKKLNFNIGIIINWWMYIFAHLKIPLNIQSCENLAHIRHFHIFFLLFGKFGIQINPNRNASEYKIAHYHIIDTVTDNGWLSYLFFYQRNVCTF